MTSHFTTRGTSLQVNPRPTRWIRSKMPRWEFCTSSKAKRTQHCWGNVCIENPVLEMVVVFHILCWLVVSKIFPHYIGNNPSQWLSYFSRWLKQPTSMLVYRRVTKNRWVIVQRSSTGGYFWNDISANMSHLYPFMMDYNPPINGKNIHKWDDDTGRFFQKSWVFSAVGWW